MRKELKKKAKNATVSVLNALLGTPEYLVNAFERKSVYRAINDSFEQEITIASICRFFNGLRRHGYINVVQTPKGESIVFTNKAKLKIIDQISANSKQDGCYRFLSFDIPERLRSNRDQFRRAIKRIGFRQIQKSLWVCNKNVSELVEIASQEYGVKQYVAYIVSQKSDIDNLIKSLFEKDAAFS